MLGIFCPQVESTGGGWVHMANIRELQMKIIKIAEIKELAQNFQASPGIWRNEAQLKMTIDYEVSSGGYSEKFIWFEDVQNFRHIRESEVTVDVIQAYNSICEVVDSNWLEPKIREQGIKHYIIYFDGFGSYEIIAKNFLCEAS